MILLAFPYFCNYRMLIIIQSLSIIFTTIGMDWINSVYEEYAFITARYIAFQVIALICMFLFVKRENDYFIYAFIVVLASAGANILNTIHIKKYVKIKLKISGLKKHLVPILVTFGNVVAITVYVNSDITMIGIIKDDTSVGIYSLASRIYTVIKLILNGVILVTIPRLSVCYGKNEKDTLDKLLSYIFITMITLMFPLSIGLCMLSKSIMSIMGGEEYTQGAMALTFLGIAVLFSLIAFFFTNCVLIPSKNEKTAFIITLSSAIINILLNFIFIPAFDYFGAAITTVIAELLVSLFAIASSRKKGIGHLLIYPKDIVSIIL